MKRVAFAMCGAFLGAALFLGVPLLMSLPPGDGVGHHGEDEAGRMLRIYILGGGPVAAVLGGWIGHVATASGRRAIWMLGAVAIATGAFCAIPWSLPLGPEDSLAAGLGGWAILSVAVATLAGRLAIPGRRAH